MARDLGTFIAIMLSSDSDNEVMKALREARKVMKAERRSGNDVAKAIREYDPQLFENNEKLLKALREVSTENERLKRLQQANGTPNTFAAQLWQTAGMPTSVDNRHAQWLLDLAGHGRHHLTPRETDFITSCARRSRLTDKMKDWLHDLVRQAIARTGEAPPP